MPRLLLTRGIGDDSQTPWHVVALVDDPSTAKLDASMAMGGAATETLDLTDDIRNLLGELLTIARAQQRTADGSMVFQYRDPNDVIRLWLGEARRCCDACGQAIAPDVTIEGKSTLARSP